VMLHTVSPPRGEAASTPLPRSTTAKSAVTLKYLAVTVRVLQSWTQSKHNFKRGRWIVLLGRFGFIGRVQAIFEAQLEITDSHSPVDESSGNNLRISSSAYFYKSHPPVSRTRIEGGS
jgi:hypothetical protein